MIIDQDGQVIELTQMYQMQRCLKNQNDGYSYNIAATVEKTFDQGWYAKFGYSYGVSKNTVDPGSIAYGSWSGNQISGDPNNPSVAYSNAFGGGTPGDKVFLGIILSCRIFQLRGYYYFIVLGRCKE